MQLRPDLAHLPPHAQAHDGAAAAEEAGRWEEERRVSRYADNLPLLETGMGRWGREIPADPALWACDETGVKENLWLNLSTGFIGSGRQARAGSLHAPLHSLSSCAQPGVHGASISPA
jgi:uncharacterized UBP type Zn finger protein